MGRCPHPTAFQDSSERCFPEVEGGREWNCGSQREALSHPYITEEGARGTNGGDEAEGVGF